MVVGVAEQDVLHRNPGGVCNLASEPLGTANDDHVRFKESHALPAGFEHQGPRV